MFKSTKEYNEAILEVLTSIRDNNTFPNPNNKFDEYSLGDVINLCNNRDYIDGINVDKNITGYYVCYGTPRLTYSGLKFIEDFKK